MEYEIPRYCCDALLIVSISEDCFNILDKDLHSWRSLVRVIGRECLGLLKRCIDGSPNQSAAAIGYAECEDMNITINISDASSGDQSARRIVGLFENLLKDLSLSFWPDGPQRWTFCIVYLRLAFEKLSIDLEASLADMREGSQTNQITSVHALTNALEPFHI